MLYSFVLAFSLFVFEYNVRGLEVLFKNSMKLSCATQRHTGSLNFNFTAYACEISILDSAIKDTKDTIYNTFFLRRRSLPRILLEWLFFQCIFCKKIWILKFCFM